MMILVIFVLSFGFLAGCSTNRVDLVDNGVLTLEKQAAEKVYIAWSDAYEDGDGFVVTGVLRRRDTVGLPIKAHVDITIQSPDGKVLNEGRSSDNYVPRRIVGKGQSFKRFKVRFPNIPVEGSKASIVVHSG
ncbi:MAG: hypothetical protein H8D47_05390 [Planctomycetes bacterium]|nr:hypothetical protein [Planctomycetota bacterium]